MDSTQRDLIDDYFVRNLSREELQELHRILAADTESRRQFVETGRDEWLLHHVHHLAEERLIRFEPRRKKRQGNRAIAAAIAVLLSLGGIYLATHTELRRQQVHTVPVEPVPVAEVAEFFVLEGETISVVNNGTVGKLDGRSKIISGDRIVVPPGCRLSYRYLNDETHVEIQGASLLKVMDEDGAKHIFLSHGRLHADVARQPQDKPMQVMTRDAKAVVLGTAFEISADQKTRLSVSSGTVRFISMKNDFSVLVDAGSTADSEHDMTMKPKSFRDVRFHPVEDSTLNHTDNPGFIAVDPVRNYSGYLEFDVGHIQGDIVEAHMKLRVMHYLKDYGGSGSVRLFRFETGSPASGREVQVSRYDGRVDAGMDLVFKIDPSELTDGINTFKITLDRGGNDFWFSSSKGAVAPELLLKVID